MAKDAATLVDSRALGRLGLLSPTDSFPSWADSAPDLGRNLEVSAKSSRRRLRSGSAASWLCPDAPAPTKGP